MTDTAAVEQSTGPDRRSVLGNLRNRREQVLEAQVLDLPVPRWSNPEIVVRYRPIEHTYFRTVQSRVEKAPKDKRGDVEIQANCDVLIRGCVEVFARLEGDSREYSLRPGDPEGEHTRFDSDLAQNLGLSENATAREVVRKLFITEADILSAAGKVSEWSGYRDTEADETVEGE